ncbi:MAG TPA: hypothetical protein PKJ98_11410 [Verrucomicrobiota bacterium]|nr:hypothetical protein [Verrucomicrobiota bacterium]
MNTLLDILVVDDRKAGDGLEAIVRTIEGALGVLGIPSQYVTRYSDVLIPPIMPARGTPLSRSTARGANLAQLVTIQAILANKDLQELVAADPRTYHEAYFETMIWRFLPDHLGHLLLASDLDLRSPEGPSGQDAHSWNNADGFVLCSEVKRVLGTRCTCWAATGLDSKLETTSSAILEFARMVHVPVPSEEQVFRKAEAGQGVGADHALSKDNPSLTVQLLRVWQVARSRFLAQYPDLLAEARQLLLRPMETLRTTAGVTLPGGRLLPIGILFPELRISHPRAEYATQLAYRAVATQYIRELCGPGMATTYAKALDAQPIDLPDSLDYVRAVWKDIVRSLPTNLSLSFARTFGCSGIEIIRHSHELKRTNPAALRDDLVWSCDHGAQRVRLLQHELDAVQDRLHASFQQCLSDFYERDADFMSVPSLPWSGPAGPSGCLEAFIRELERLKTHLGSGTAALPLDLRSWPLLSRLIDRRRKHVGEIITNLNICASWGRDRLNETGKKTTGIDVKAVAEGVPGDFVHWPLVSVFREPLTSFLAWAQDGQHPHITSVWTLREPTAVSGQFVAILAFSFAGSDPCFDARQFIQGSLTNDWIGGFGQHGFELFGRMYLLLEPDSPHIKSVMPSAEPSERFAECQKTDPLDYKLLCDLCTPHGQLHGKLPMLAMVFDDMEMRPAHIIQQRHSSCA